MVAVAKQTKPIKKKYTFYAVLGIIGDIVFYPIIFISLLSSVIMFFNKTQGKVPSLFGTSLVCVLSESMEASGFEKGHNVFVKRTKAEDLQVGDIIAFYYHKDPADESITQTIVASKEADFDNRESFIADENFEVPQRKKLKDLSTKSIKVYFHQIIEIYFDEGGTSFFVTKGTSNSSADTIRTREDYVVGRYVNTPVWLRNVFRFCTTQTGMIILVITPLSILIMIQSLSIIEQINNILLEKKILERKEPYDSKESLKANIGIEMDIPKKIYFYAKMPEEEKQKVWDFLWDYLEISTKEKQRNLYNIALISKEKLDINATEYYNYWRNNIKSKRFQKQLNKMQSRFNYENSIQPLLKNKNK